MKRKFPGISICADARYWQPDKELTITKEQWDRIKKGETVEISQTVYDHYLNAVPPFFLYRKVILLNGETLKADYGFVEGGDRVTAFFTRDGKHFVAATVLAVEVCEDREEV